MQHRRLGLASPGFAAFLVIVTTTTFFDLFPDKLADGVSSAEATVFSQQIRSVVLFVLFYVWALSARLKDSDTHIRMLFMATVVLMDAGVGRLMRTLPVMEIEEFHRHDVVMFWQFSLLIPALIYDAVKLHRIHRAWLIGLGITAPWVIATCVFHDDPAWLALATRWMGGMP